MANHIYSILMCAAECYPLHGPEAIVNAKLVAAMLSVGWHVDVLSCSEGFSMYPNDNTWEHVRRQTHSIVVPKGGRYRNLLEKTLNVVKYGHALGGLVWAGRAIEVGSDLLARNHYDVVISRYSPEESHLPALVLSRKHRIPWIANWNDPYAIEQYPPPYGRGKEARLPSNRSRYLDAILRSAAWHTFPCERLRNHMADYFPLAIDKKSTVIPHVAGEQDASKAPETSREFRLCYIGNIRPPRYAGTLLQGLRKFLDRTQKVDVRLIFIGQVHPGTLLRVKELNLERSVAFEKPVRYGQAIERLYGFHVMVVIEASCPVGIFLPSKFVDYVQSGRPIFAVSPKTGTLNDILSSQGGGIAVDVTDPSEIAQGLSMLYESWRDGALNERFGSRHLNSLFSRQRVIGMYHNLIERLVHGNS